MLTIFEGIEYTGKTTISELISKNLIVPVFNCQELINNLSEDNEKLDWTIFGANKTVLDLAAKLSFDLILDELFLSDLCNSSFIRHKNISLKLKTYKELIKKIDLKIFLLTINKEQLKLRIINKTKKTPTNDFLNNLIIFQTFFEETAKQFNPIFIDVSYKSKEQLKLIILQKVKK